MKYVLLNFILLYFIVGGGGLFIMFPKDYDKLDLTRQVKYMLNKKIHKSTFHPLK